MTFPTVQTTNETAVSTAGTSHAINLPTGIAAGDLIVILLDKGSTAATFNSLAGWTEVVDENSANGITVWARDADGSEGATVTFTSSASTRSASISYRITGAATTAQQLPELSTVATGSSTAPDATTCTPTGGVKDYLWITFFGRAGEEADDDTWATSAPTNYSNLLQKACGVAGTNLGGIIASAERTNNAASEDAGAFTIATGSWRAYTLAIHPAPVQPTGDPYQRDPRWYRANIFFRPSGEAFQTLGDATSPTGEMPITLTDTGAGDDAITVAADVPLSDAGSAADSISVDTGIGIDPNQAWPQFEPHLIRPGAQPFQTLGDSTATSPATPITLDDAGTATDALSVFVESDQNQAGPQFATMFLEPSAAALQLFGDATTNAPTPITLLDVGDGADSLTVAAAVPLDDAGAASDALTVSAAVSLTDAGAGSDALIVSAAVPLTDTGAGSDAVTIAADVPLTDAAVGTDSISVQVLGEPDPYQAAPLPFPSFATLFAEPQAKPLQLLGDASGIAQISLTDSGIGDDTLSVSATLPLSDSAAGADSVSVAATVPLNDAATGIDGVALTAAVPLADAATGDDALSVLVSVVTDANQAIPKQFGWSYLQPGWVVPFQFLGSREAAPGLVNATSTPTVTAGRGSTATVISATTSAPAVSAAATSIPSVSDG